MNLRGVMVLGAFLTIFIPAQANNFLPVEQGASPLAQRLHALEKERAGLTGYLNLGDLTPDEATAVDARLALVKAETEKLNAELRWVYQLGDSPLVQFYGAS